MKKYAIAFLDRKGTWQLLGYALSDEHYKDRCFYNCYGDAARWIEHRTTAQRNLGQDVTEYMIIDVDLEE